MNRLQLDYTDGSGKVIPFSDNSGQYIIEPETTLGRVRRDAPAFFDFAKGCREHRSTYRGFVLCRHTYPDGIRRTVIYAWDCKRADTFWIKDVRTQREAKRIIDELWAKPWTRIDQSKGYRSTMLIICPRCGETHINNALPKKCLEAYD